MKGSLLVLADPINSESYVREGTCYMKEGELSTCLDPLLSKLFAGHENDDDEMMIVATSSLILSRVEENNPKRPCQQLISLKKQAE